MRVVGLDLGARRIGVAVSDASGTLASPRTIVIRSGDAAADRTAIASLVREEGADMLVVGLPVSMDGREREPAAAARAEAAALAEAVGVPVEIQDERLTTVQAARLRRDLPPGGRPSRGARRRRRPVDAEAAAVMLQSWLDAHRAGR